MEEVRVLVTIERPSAVLGNADGALLLGSQRIKPRTLAGRKAALGSHLCTFHLRVARSDRGSFGRSLLGGGVGEHEVLVPAVEVDFRHHIRVLVGLVVNDLCL